MEIPVLDIFKKWHNTHTQFGFREALLKWNFFRMAMNYAPNKATTALPVQRSRVRNVQHVLIMTRDLAVFLCAICTAHNSAHVTEHDPKARAKKSVTFFARFNLFECIIGWIVRFTALWFVPSSILQYMHVYIRNRPITSRVLVKTLVLHRRSQFKPLHVYPRFEIRE